jgi:hypothetical protein
MVRSYQVETGDPVVNVAGWPHVVLEDTDDLVAVYIRKAPSFGGGTLRRGDAANPELAKPIRSASSSLASRSR